MITPIDTTSTPFWPWFAAFLLIAFGTAAIVADGITTMVGLGANKGFVEANKLMRWMFSKIGQSLTCWLSAVLVCFLSLFIISHAYGPGMLFAGTVAAGETYFAVHNYLLLKKLGIKL
jgi:hypothetical protein